jgi:hypothetical protein
VKDLSARVFELRMIIFYMAVAFATGCLATAVLIAPAPDRRDTRGCVIVGAALFIVFLVVAALPTASGL